MRNLFTVLLALVTVSLAVNPPDKGPFPANFWKLMEKNILQDKYGDPAWAQRMAARREARQSFKKGLNSDVFKLPVILSDFSDLAGQFSANTFQDHLFDNNPTGTMTEYYDEISYGQFDLSGTVYGWVHTGQNLSYYAGDNNGNSGTFPQNVKGFVYESVQAADDSIDYALYDNDGPDGIPNSGDDDGYVDAVAVVYAGAGAEVWPGNDSFWPHMSSLGDNAYTTNDVGADGNYIKVSTYFVCPEESGGGTGNGTIREIGVYTHEFGHVLGLPDLYDRTGSGDGPDYEASEGIGEWGLMAAGSWGGDGSHSEKPAHMIGWSKYQLGWVTPTVITSPQSNVQILRAETNKSLYLMWEDGYEFDRYWLIENRQKTGFDQYLNGSGLLIFHIDESRRWGKARWSSGPVNNDETHKMVDLEEADGNADLDNSVNRGDDGDPYPGSSNNTVFDNNSTPNSKDYDGKATNMAVSNISASGTIMTADLTPRQLFGYAISYDELGISGWGWGLSSAGDFWGGVKFTAPEAGKLTIVDIGFRENNVPYEVLVYDSFDGTSPGTLITSVTDSAAQNGWYHVALPQTMNVSAGQDFFVAVKIINKAYGISFDYSTPTGRSFTSSDGVNYDDAISAYGDINIRARIQTGTPTALEELLLTPEQFRLAQNYPNPFNPATVIEYNLPQKSMVKLEIFNTLGKRVAVLQNGVQPAGVHSINFDASGLASGVYYYRIETDFGRQGKQMLLLK